MSKEFAFNLIAEDGNARSGEITMPRGTVRTPAFMPVGTAATVKAMFPGDVRAAGADIVLANTYHLMLRPGAEEIAALGGLHQFMNWPHPILTDSGGFQVMSLAKLRELSEEGVTFRSHIDGGKYLLTPERAVEVQTLLGADIQMQLDECTPYPASEQQAGESMRLSLRWAERSKKTFGVQAGRAIFGIVQGSNFDKLRAESARELIDLDFPGYSIGGLAVGEGQEEMLRVLDVTLPLMPRHKPRYLMGVGTPLDIIESVHRGIDMFDCVMPTRAGRHGLAYTRHGKINLRNARHKGDPRPLDETSNCEAARIYSRAYLHHLIKAGEYLGAMLLTMINIHYYQGLMAAIRGAIANGKYDGFCGQTKEEWTKGDLPPRG